MVVSGPPGSGKSTLGRALADHLDLPYLAKDTVKEALADVLGADDVDGSRRLGRAAVATLLAVATDAGRGVLDATWRPALARNDLAALPGEVVEVHCACPPELARRRYARRAADRHAVHFDRDRTDDPDLWAGDATRAIGGPWPVVTVDTTTPVDVAGVADAITARLR